jgi:hypothetical protein
MFNGWREPFDWREEAAGSRKRLLSDKHHGMSAQFCVRIFEKLLQFGPQTFTHVQSGSTDLGSC